MVQVGYVGNRGVHLTGGYNLNRLFPGTSNKPYPNFGSISMTRTDLISNYNSLQTSFRRRFARGLTFNANYTWLHSLDEGGIAFGTAAQDDHNPRDAYGNADYDARHLLEFDYTYEIPAPTKALPFLFNGWRINGLTQMRDSRIGQRDVRVRFDADRLCVITARPGARRSLAPGECGYSECPV